jgi:uncharacterized protein YkwD
MPAACHPSEPEVTEPVSISARQFRYTLVAGATAVVIGVGFTVAGFQGQGDAASPVGASGDAPLVVAKPPAYAGAPGGDLLLDDAASTAPPEPPSASPTTKPTTTRPAPPKTKPTTTKPATTRPTTTKPTPTSEPSQPADAPATGGTILDQVLEHINAARTAAGLAPYALDGSLSKASALHNQLMIDGCGLSHQCAGEAGIGERFSAQGVQWRSAGENIGYASAGAGDADIARAANGLTDSMLAEVPPQDGHRKNLLSSGFKKIGLSVVRDGKGIVWMTQDFVG